jgi:plastocyanin
MVLLLVACGGNSEPEEVEFTIEMSEFSYTPDTIELKVGQTVTLNLVNKGQLEHEVMFGREVLMDNSLPSGYELDLFEHAGVEPNVMMEMHMEEHEEAEHDADEADHEEAEHDDDEAEHADDMAEHGHSGFMVALTNEDTATMTFTVTEEMVGTWEIGCFLQSGSHHLAGMKGSLEVDA